MLTVTVKTEKSYPVLIGNGVLDDLADFLSGKVFAVCDPRAYALHGTRLLRAVGDATVFVTEGGEKSKTLSSLTAVLSLLAEKGFTRADTLVTFGGGTVGDLGGLAASLFKRGMRFVQIPTTLLSAVDASVGGKTAVDFADQKNAIGTFYQPDAVLCDLSLLETLSPSVFRQGLSEAVKMSFLTGGDRLSDAVHNGDTETVITECVRIKSDIVSRDETDCGDRRLLNFGHTVAHAVEVLSGYAIPHGDAVAIGLYVETKAAVACGLCSDSVLLRLEAMLAECGLGHDCKYDAASLAKAVLSDKKSDGKSITFSLPGEDGICRLVPVAVDDLRAFLEGGLT